MSNILYFRRADRRVRRLRYDYIVVCVYKYIFKYFLDERQKKKNPKYMVIFFTHRTRIQCVIITQNYIYIYRGDCLLRRFRNANISDRPVYVYIYNIYKRIATRFLDKRKSRVTFFSSLYALLLYNTYTDHPRLGLDILL